MPQHNTIWGKIFLKRRKEELTLLSLLAPKHFLLFLKLKSIEEPIYFFSFLSCYIKAS